MSQRFLFILFLLIINVSFSKQIQIKGMANDDPFFGTLLKLIARLCNMLIMLNLFFFNKIKGENV